MKQKKKIEFNYMLINSKVHKLPGETSDRSNLYLVVFCGQRYNQLILTQFYIQNSEYLGPAMFERSKIYVYHST